MKILHNISELSPAAVPAVLTIGSFDGVHLGHREVLNRVISIAKQEGRPSAVITFENHPVDILKPGHHTALLCSVQHKIKLLEEMGIDNLILLPFTKEFSRQTAEEFLAKVFELFPFANLVLGHDAVLGRDRHGNSEHVQGIASRLHFKVEYLSPYQIATQVISSSVIRSLIQQGNLPQAEKFLGRKFSIFAQVIEGAATGRRLGFPTANFDVSSLCFPPLGVYAVRMIQQKREYDGVANLGVAPTLRQGSEPLLEVHLLDQSKEMYGEWVEVIFYQFIRSEMKFSDSKLLQLQIKQDIQVARQILSSKR